MTLTQLQVEIGENLGRDDTTTYTYIKNQLNFLLQEYFPRKGAKPFLKEDSSIVTTANQRYVAMPSDFKRLEWAEFRTAATVDWTPLRLMDWEDFQFVTDKDEPEYAAIFLNASGLWRLHFTLIPSASNWQIRIYYFAGESALANPSDESNMSKVYGDDALISGATFRVARKLSLWDIADRWVSYFSVDLAELLSWQGAIQGKRHESPTGSMYV